MKNTIKIFLAPSKTLNEQDGDIYSPSSPIFENEASLLVAALREKSKAELASLLSISKVLAESSYLRFKTWDIYSAKDNNALQAINSFSGEVYRGLDYKSLNAREKEFSNECVYILSGLYGLLKPSDMIYPYRLEMGTKFSPNATSKNLYFFWKQKVNHFLLDSLNKEEIILNLASQEYFKVIDTSIIKNRIISPVFKEYKNGKFTIVMMYAKHARGAMARYLIKNQLNNIDDLKSYSIDSYSFDARQSSENEWVFVR